MSLPAEHNKPWSLKAVNGGGVTVFSAAERDRPIDALLGRKLASSGLQPFGRADRATLLRRAYLDLIGLPPSPAELDQFLSDESPNAYEKVVDGLLARPQYGERYARHWLDVLRYADVDGNMPAENGLHHWRTWVIAALNRDLPYDEFVKAQIAGDLSKKADDVFATGFLARGATGKDDKDQELAFSAVETVSTAFMGMTVGCARCHDHMFDPIKQQDFYAMKSLFDPLVVEKRTMATAEQISEYSQRLDEYEARKKEMERPIKALIGPIEKRLREERIEMLAPEAQTAIRKSEDDRTEAEQKIADDYAPVLRIDPPKIEDVMSEEDRQTYRELRKPLRALKAPERLPVFWTVREDAKRMDAKGTILSGGDPAKPGATVEPGFPFSSGTVSFHRGRRQTFVKWLTAPANPLFARVAVNRLWQWHFGRGLVGTSSDFGNMGDDPANAELLDWLASEFVRLDFSQKAIHRLIVLSEAYQRASAGEPGQTAANAKIDPNNKLQWRFSLQRLDAEAVRDSILVAAGDLDLTVGGASFRDGPEQRRLGSDEVIGHFDTRSNRRAIYMGRGFHEDREMMPGFLQVFDADDGRRPCPRRTQTVTAPQALTFMNSALVDESAAKLAKRMAEQAKGDLVSAVDFGYRTVLARRPSAAEKDSALSYVNGDPDRLRGFAWLLLNLDEFLYVR